MKFGILGTGMVGATIAKKLAGLGHDVRVGSRTRTADNVTFAEAASFGDIVFNCTKGSALRAVLEAAGPANLRNKILIDTSNPLDFSKGGMPSLFTDSGDSLGEQIQRALPETKVVKSLNTINCNIMVDPKRVAGGDHTVFVCGNDADAKKNVSELLGGFGWKHIVDLGDITASRGVEAYLLLWLRAYGALGTADFNVKIVR
jgi:8-hydroxy-5-deazaflavin:NADPH oxidoreductase